MDMDSVTEMKPDSSYIVATKKSATYQYKVY